MCGRTARTVRGGGSWKRNLPGQGKASGTARRETFGNEGLPPYRQHETPRQLPTLQSTIVRFGRSPVRGRRSAGHPFGAAVPARSWSAFGRRVLLLTHARRPASAVYCRRRSQRPEHPASIQVWRHPGFDRAAWPARSRPYDFMIHPDVPLLCPLVGSNCLLPDLGAASPARVCLANWQVNSYGQATDAEQLGMHPATNTTPPPCSRWSVSRQWAARGFPDTSSSTVRVTFAAFRRRVRSRSAPELPECGSDLLCMVHHGI